MFIQQVISHSDLHNFFYSFTPKQLDPATDEVINNLNSATDGHVRKQDQRTKTKTHVSKCNLPVRSR